MYKLVRLEVVSSQDVMVFVILCADASEADVRNDNVYLHWRLANNINAELCDVLGSEDEGVEVCACERAAVSNFNALGLH